MSDVSNSKQKVDSGDKHTVAHPIRCCHQCHHPNQFSVARDSELDVRNGK